MKTTAVLLQTLIIIAGAPLISGVIRKIKNNMRMRRGAGVLQPYYNMLKLFRKEEVVSANTSWIFAAAPYVVLSSVVAALLLVPVVRSGPAMGSMGDMLAVIFLLALGRFFIALAGLDAGSAFGGMGSSREMFISSIVEPVVLLVFFAVSIQRGSTGFSAGNAFSGLTASSFIATAALLLVILAETSRIPVDNQETHLELTMVHEAMVLEYSGRSLALIELAAHIKQAMFFVLAAGLIFPSGLAALLLKIAVIGAGIAVLEVSTAKMRLFRVVDFFGFGLVLACIAMIAAVLGH